MPSEMVLDEGAFGRWLGYEGGILWNGVHVLLKEIPQSSLATSAI